MKKRSLIYGVTAGLAAGGVMFWIAMLPTFAEGTILYRIFDVFNRPVLWLVAWMHETIHGSGLYELLTAFLCYWVVLGLLAGIGCRRLFTRGHAAPKKITGENAGGTHDSSMRMCPAAASLGSVVRRLWSGASRQLSPDLGR